MENVQQTILKKRIENTINYRSTKAQRLLKNEAFIQHINILYSCFGAFLSVWSLMVEHRFISFMVTIISIILVLSITYFNSQRYAARAKDLEANILDLRNLQAELLVQLSEKDLPEKEKIYNSYLAASEGEDDYDKLYHNIFEYLPNEDGKINVGKCRKIQFYFMAVFRLLLKGAIIVLPFFITFFLIYSVCNETIVKLDSLGQMDAFQESQQEEEDDLNKIILDGR